VQLLIWIITCTRCTVHTFKFQHLLHILHYITIRTSNDLYKRLETTFRYKACSQSTAPYFTPDSTHTPNKSCDSTPNQEPLLKILSTLQVCSEGTANERVADNALFFLLKLLANEQTSWDEWAGGVGLCNSWSHSRQPQYGLLIV
jgi:hypothetical protein